MKRLVEPAYPGAPARHHVFCFGKFRGQKLSTVPGWYLTSILRHPRLDPDVRRVIFEALQQSSDRRFAVDQVVSRHAMQATGTTPPKKTRTRKERKDA
jgi:hypothetical protein